MVGTRVRERRYDASIAKTTASASGTNRYRATPVRKNIGTNTMQMESVETKRRDRDLLRAVENRLLDLLALFEIAVDVLDLDRGVVHQDADRQRQAAQRHDVDRLAQRAQHDERRQDRQRNRDRDDQRAAPAAQEDQDHERRSGRRRSAPRAPRR